MVDDRESPSAGWREVYREMDADTRIEDPTAPCPDCGQACQHVARDVYDCAEHGLFRASKPNSKSETETQPNAENTSEENDEADTRARGPAD